MVLPDQPVALSPQQIASLLEKLSVMRHNINNHLGLIIAASELMQRKPDALPRLLPNIIQQPERVVAEMRAFTEELESLLGVARAPQVLPSARPPEHASLHA